MLQIRLSLRRTARHLKELLEKVNMDDMSDAQIAEIKAGKEKLMESAQKLLLRCMNRPEQQPEHREQTRTWGQARIREQALHRTASREMTL